MRIPLIDLLLRKNPAAAEIDESLETILDIRSQNLFLKKLLLLLGSCLAGLCVVVLLLAVLLVRPQPSKPASGVWYADQAAPGDLGDDPSATKEGLPGSDVSGERAHGVLKKGIVAIKRLLGGEDKSKKSSGAVPAPRAENEDPRGSQEKAGDRRRELLWKLLDTVKDHPRRQLIDKTYGKGGLAVTFIEGAPGGMFRFRMDNGAQRTVYLPRLATPGLGFDVYIERRVLEPGESAEGVVRLKEPVGKGGLRVMISAANLKAEEFTVEVPQW